MYILILDIVELLEPLERAINERSSLIPAVTDHIVIKVERDPLGFPVHMRSLGFTDPVETLIFGIRGFNQSY